MTRVLLVLAVAVLFLPGCVTAPPAASVASAATPKVIGPESGYTGAGMPGAHEWIDDDARTALWLRRNLPERWSEVPFPIIEFFRYNIHHDRQQFSPFEWEYYFADMRDPYLQVRMFSLESRDRNRVKRNEVIAKEAAEKASEEVAVMEDVSLMSDQAVQEKLGVVYP
jgi:hypothetical protein